MHIDEDRVKAPSCKLCGGEMYYEWDGGMWTFHLSSGTFLCPEKRSPMKWLRRLVYNRGFRPKPSNPLYSPSMNYLAAMSDQYFLPGGKIVFKKNEGYIKTIKKGSTHA